MDTASSSSRWRCGDNGETTTSAKRKAEDGSKHSLQMTKRSRHDPKVVHERARCERKAIPAVTAVFSTTELVEAIVSYLYHTKDLVRCKRVCHEFNDVINGTPSKAIRERLFLEARLPRGYTDLMKGYCGNQYQLQAELHGVPEDSILIIEDSDEGSAMGNIVVLNPAIPPIASHWLSNTCFSVNVQRLLETYRGTSEDRAFSRAFICQPPYPAKVYLPRRKPKGIDIPDPIYYSCKTSINAGLTIKDLAKAFVQIDEDFGGKLDLNKLLIMISELD